MGAGLSRVQDLHASGWYSSNTHTHYHREIDEDPDDRLRMVPPAEALDVSVISYLATWKWRMLPVATPKASCRAAAAISRIFESDGHTLGGLVALDPPGQPRCL